MARLPRPIRHFIRRLKGQTPGQAPGAVNPQMVGLHPRSTMRFDMPLPMLLFFMVLGIAIAGAQVLQAFHAGNARTQIVPPGAIGSLHSVFLPGNQVFIGTLESVDHGTVVLADVFYLQTQGAQAANPLGTADSAPSRGAQLVRRADSDWHQPTHMSIPIDKILLIENVGRDSIVTRLITEGRARQRGGAPAQ